MGEKVGRKPGGKKTGGRVKGTQNRFNYLLDLMLRKVGFNFAAEFKKALLKLSETPNQESDLVYLEVLFRMLPYIAVKFNDSDTSRIEAALAKYDAIQRERHIPVGGKEEEINNILTITKDKDVADGSPND